MTLPRKKKEIDTLGIIHLSNRFEESFELTVHWKCGYLVELVTKNEVCYFTKLMILNYKMIE